MTRESAIKSVEENSEDIISSLQFLAKAGIGSDIQKIFPLTKSSNNSIRLTATASVAAIIRRALVTEYKNYRNEVKDKLEKLLTQLDPAIIHETLQALNSSNEDIRLNAIKTIEYIDSKNFKKQIIAHLLENGNEKIRATTVNLLQDKGSRENKAIFSDLITDPDPRVRANTVEVIENLQDDKLLYLLYRLKTDPNNRVRANTLKALFKIGKKRVKEEIFRMLESDDPLMQASALWVISEVELSDSSSKMHCQLLQHSSDEIVAKQAKNALAVIIRIENSVK
jgi:HEAT repeat protein